jgi:hypothetical protein
MTLQQHELDVELKRILWAVFSYWNNESQQKYDRSICYSWVVTKYESRFKTKFHQSKLGQLEKNGYLQKLETARGGSRRYYTIPDPDRISELLKEWKLL